MDFVLENAMNKAFEKTDKISLKIKGFPHITKDGTWLENTNGHWTGGFWAGLNWLSYLEKGSKNLIARAEDYTGRLEARKNDNKTHDQGFIFGPSCVLGYNITGSKKYKELAFCGARNMNDLYNKNSELILAWDEKGYENIAIIDTIMNLPLMIWASDMGGDPQYKTNALKTAQTIKNNYIREDGSTFHVIKWDDEYNLVGGTHQGYADNSCWSRGQAWALNGFANLYRYHNDEEYLAVAGKLADYYIGHMEDNYLPKWDFYFKNDALALTDSAAASIAANGMILLAQQYRLTGKKELAEKYNNTGISILKSLINECLYDSLDKYGIIKHAVVDFPRKSGINESTMYGDYYFTEALWRLKHNDNQEKLDLLF